MEVNILNFGARVSSIKLPIKHQLMEMTVGYDEVEDYLTDSSYLGATCGPVTNRISNAQFSIDDMQYSLSANGGAHTLHGGEGNVSFRFWTIDTASLTENFIKLTLSLDDLEDGFPGQRVFTAEYTLTQANELIIQYSGVTDKTSPMNMTNHTYFSLGQSSCLSHSIQLSSSAFLERQDDGIPTGNIISNSLICQNLRANNTLKEIINNTQYSQIAVDEGLDHCFILDNTPFETPKIALYSQESGVKLSVFTEQAAVQIYTAKFLSEPFHPYQGVCLECHGYVDAVNQPSFASILIRPEEIYTNKTVYQFDFN